jgi:hypothetical protein
MTSERTIPFFITSDPNKGYVSQNGSMVTLNINPPIILDERKKKEMALVDASIWWNFYNIGPEFNNNTFRWTNGGNATTYTYTLPGGLYGISELEETISESVRNDGYSENTFRFQVDRSNAFLSIQVNLDDVTIHWSDATSIGQMIGFINDDTITTAGTFVESDRAVTLNTLTEILIHANIITGVVYNNNGSADILHSIVPDVFPQSLIAFEPEHLLWCPLITNHIDKLVFYLTDQNNTLLNTRGEIFTATLLIRERD